MAIPLLLASTTIAACFQAAPSPVDAFAQALAHRVGSGRPGPREVALDILRSMGRAGSDALAREGSDEARALAATLRSENPALDAKLRAYQPQFRAKALPLDTVLRLMAAPGQFAFEVDPGLDLRQLKAEEPHYVGTKGFDEVLGELLAPHRLSFTTTAAGTIRIFSLDSPASPLAARSPLLLDWPVPSGLDRLIADLASEDLATRSAAPSALMHPGAAAALWKAADSADPEVAATAGSVLRALYGVGRARAAKASPLDVELPLAADEYALDGVLDAVADRCKCSYAWTAPFKADVSFTWGGRVGPAKDLLNSLLLPTKSEAVIEDGLLIVATRDRIVRSTAAANALPWMDATLANALESLIPAAGREAEAKKLEALGAPALRAVRYAQRLLDPASSAALGTVADRILASTMKTAWLIDEPPAWKRQELKGADLELRKRLEDGVVSAKEAGVPVADALGRLLAPLKIGVKGLPARDIVTFRFEKVRAALAIEALLRPLGMEAVIEKGELVIR